MTDTEFTDAKWLQNKFNRSIASKIEEWAETAVTMAGGEKAMAIVLDFGTLLLVDFEKGGKRHHYKRAISATAIQELHEWAVAQ